MENDQNDQNDQKDQKDQNDQEEEEYDAVALIGDAIDYVLEYLELKDVFSVAQVCRLWREAAARETLKRLRIQNYRLPYEFQKMTVKLDVNRSTAMFICDSKFRNTSQDDNSANNPDATKAQLLQFLRLKQIKKTIVVIANDYLTTEDLIIQGARHESEFLGYFFPNMKRRTQTQVACIQEFDPEEIDMQVDQLGEELGFDHSEYPTSTVLLFVSGKQNMNADQVINKLRRRVPSGEKITTFSIFGDKLIVTDGIDEDLEKPILLQDFLAVRISGANVETWSTLFYCQSETSVIESKLKALKDKVKPRHHYHGLIYSPKCCLPQCSHETHKCCSSYEIMRRVNSAFPDIRFVGFFRNINLKRLTEKDFSFGQDDGYFLFLYTSIIIISYD